MKKQKLFDMRARRKELGMTIEQVAARAGISSAAVRQIEVGAYKGTFMTLHKIASVLGIPARYLMTEEQLKVMSEILSGIKQSVENSSSEV